MLSPFFFNRFSGFFLHSQCFCSQSFTSQCQVQFLLYLSWRSYQHILLKQLFWIIIFPLTFTLSTSLLGLVKWPCRQVHGHYHHAIIRCQEEILLPVGPYIHVNVSYVLSFRHFARFQKVVVVFQYCFDIQSLLLRTDLTAGGISLLAKYLYQIWFCAWVFPSNIQCFEIGFPI